MRGTAIAWRLDSALAVLEDHDAPELDRSFEAETQRALKLSERITKQLLEGKFEGDLLRESPFAVPELTVGGPGYKIDFLPKVLARLLFTSGWASGR